MHEPGVSEEALAFVQRAQIAAGAWLPACPRHAAVLAACTVLRTVPHAENDRDASVVAAVLARIASRLPAGSRESPGWATRIRRDPVGRVLATSLEPTICLTRVAADVGLSKWHVSRLIHTVTGFTFRDLVHGARVYAALDLLVRSALSIKEVAARVGYRATGELDRQFVRRLHMTPTVFRRLLRDGANA